MQPDPAALLDDAVLQALGAGPRSTRELARHLHKMQDSVMSSCKRLAARGLIKKELKKWVLNPLAGRAANLIDGTPEMNSAYAWRVVTSPPLGWNFQRTEAGAALDADRRTRAMVWLVKNKDPKLMRMLSDPRLPQGLREEIEKAAEEASAALAADTAAPQQRLKSINAVEFFDFLHPRFSTGGDE